MCLLHIECFDVKEYDPSATQEMYFLMVENMTSFFNYFKNVDDTCLWNTLHHLGEIYNEKLHLTDKFCSREEKSGSTYLKFHLSKVPLMQIFCHCVD